MHVTHRVSDLSQCNCMCRLTFLSCSHLSSLKLTQANRQAGRPAACNTVVAEFYYSSATECSACLYQCCCCCYYYFIIIIGHM
ncbi:unnamed protein product [Ceratitis capitata]|uniref:(Mediterranean fruit fly) hypothetical protein n=1 Tax=Ceratitis capitata TaxID=7213 RepID=A0A811UZY2_CERCA|nr:unnamed protein product [Ceratitis capitata]